ncbi:glycosyltransferase family 39 protein [Streptomyces sp. NPDC002676]
MYEPRPGFREGTISTLHLDPTRSRRGDASSRITVHPAYRHGRATGGALPALLPAVAALALGLWGIDRHDSMWRDESVTDQVAHRSVGQLWHLLGHIDAVHGLYYLLMHAVFALWDGGLVALRLPSTLAMALAAAGVGTIGARLAGRRAGVLAGLVFAVLPVTQQYAQEGRSYALVTAGVTWATYLFLRGIESARRRWWTAYAVTLALTCWLHEFAALVPAAHALTLWRLRVPRRVWSGWGAAAAAVLAALAPLALVSAGQADRQLGWLRRPGLSMWLQFAGLVAAGALSACLVLRGTGTGRSALVRLALPMLMAPSGLLMTVSLVKPWYVDRYVLYGMTGLALLVGAALDRAVGLLRHRLPPAARILTACLAAVAAVAVLLPWSLRVRSPESRKDDAVAVAKAVAGFTRPGDDVLFLPARRREWLLSSPSLYAGLHDLALAESPVASGTLEGTELPADTIGRRIRAAHRIVALADPPGQPLDPYPQEVVKRQELRRHFEVCERTRVHGAQVLVYTRVGHCVRRPS